MQRSKLYIFITAVRINANENTKSYVTNYTKEKAASMCIWKVCKGKPILQLWLLKQRFMTDVLPGRRHDEASESEKLRGTNHTWKLYKYLLEHTSTTPGPGIEPNYKLLALATKLIKCVHIWDMVSLSFQRIFIYNNIRIKSQPLREYDNW